jgi:gliding motility-associated-like protein
MKKLLFSSLVFFCANAILLAQKPFFNKKISNKVSVTMNQIVPIENDGFVTFGRWIEPGSPLVVGPLAIKFDKNGNIQWSKKIEGAAGLGGFANGIVLKNGNYLVAYDGSQSRNYLTLFDNTFTPIWTLQVGSGNIPAYLNYFTELSDGNIAATGYNYNTSNGLQIVILNPASGAVIWAKQYESIMSLNSINVRTIKETNDGQLLISGNAYGDITTGANSVRQKNKLIKIKRLDGNIIWQKEFTSDVDYYESIQQIFEDNSGNFYLNFYGFKTVLTPFTNYNKNKDGIVKLDKDANIKWFRTYGDTTVFMSSFLQKKDGSFLALVDDYQKNLTHYLNINQDGDITAQSQELSPAAVTKACFTNDGSLIAAGLFNDCEFATTIYLQKRGNNGTGNCSAPSNLKVANDNIAVSNYFKDTQVKGGILPKKVVSFKVVDYPLTISDEKTFCQDTSFVKRCLGATYMVGKNKYTIDGVYKDTIKTINCDSVVLSKLTFIKNGITKIDTSICTGKSFSLNQKNYTQAGVYQDVLKNSLGCDSTVSLNLKVQDIEITVSDDITVLTAEKTLLSATSNFTNVQWQWSPPTYLSCTDCPNPTATPLSSIVYTVKVKSKLGCSAQDNINVNVKACNQVFIPSAFSPNLDGINEKLTVFTTSCATKVIKYAIFDRWGGLVYELSDFPPNDLSYGWDGQFRNQAASKGVYVYQISVEFTDGKIRNFSGDVFLE